MALEQLPVLSGQLELLDKIREGLLDGKIIVLGGASGSGRSVLCEKVLASMEEETTSEAYISSLDVNSGAQVQSLVLQQLFPEYLQAPQKQEEVSFKQVFIRYAESITTPCLVVLDDADCLSSVFLETIADVIASSSKRLLLLVTCHTGSERQLSALFLKKSCASLELRMPVLSPDDCCIVEASASRCAGGDITGRLHERDFFVGKEWTPGRIEQETQIIAAADRQKAVADKENKEVEKTGMYREKNKLLLVLGTSVALIVICLVYCVLAYIRYVNEQASTVNMDASDKKSTEVTVATSEDSVVAALPDSLTEDNVVVKDGSKEAKNEIVLDDEALKSIADAQEKPEVDANVSNDSVSQNEIASNKVEKQEAPSKSELDSKSVTADKAGNVAADKGNAVQVGTNGANDPALSKDLNRSSVTNKETQKNNNGAIQEKAKQAASAPSVKELLASTPLNNQDSSQVQNQEDATLGADTNTKLQSARSENQVNSASPANSEESSQAKKADEATSFDSASASSHKKVTAQKFSELSGKSLVVQVIATPSRRNAEQTAAKLNGRVQTWVLNRPAKGDFIAVVGPFLSKSEADKAISTFPAEIRKAGPWTKSVAAVRRDLK